MPETTLANQSLRNAGFLKESQMEVSLIQDFADSVLMRFAMRIGCDFKNLHAFLRKSRASGGVAFLVKTSDE